MKHSALLILLFLPFSGYAGEHLSGIEQDYTQYRQETLQQEIENLEQVGKKRELRSYEQTRKDLLIKSLKQEQRQRGVIESPPSPQLREDKQPIVVHKITKPVAKGKINPSKLGDGIKQSVKEAPLGLFGTGTVTKDVGVITQDDEPVVIGVEEAQVVEPEPIVDIEAQLEHLTQEQKNELLLQILQLLKGDKK